MVHRSVKYNPVGNGGNGGEGETQMVVEINRIKGKTLSSYKRTVMEAILMVVHLRIILCPVKMVQLAI